MAILIGLGPVAWAWRVRGLRDWVDGDIVGLKGVW